MRFVGSDYKDRFTTHAEDVAEMVNLKAIGPAAAHASPLLYRSFFGCKNTTLGGALEIIGA
jgi:hypothetical protein